MAALRQTIVHESQFRDGRGVGATTTDPTTNTRTAADDDFYYYRCDRLPMLLYFFIFLLISFEYKGRNSADHLTIVGEKNSTI